MILGIEVYMDTTQWLNGDGTMVVLSKGCLDRSRNVISISALPL